MAEQDRIDEAKARYKAEREKRLRDDAQDQYSQLTDEYEAFDHDPWVEPGFTREPVVTETTVVIVGGGFAGMLTAKGLQERGITDYRIIDKAGDFGGTWYWNRYPGCMCDVESLIYLPLLEETGYTPTMKYAPASEIFEQCQRIGRQYELYPHALFQTEIEETTWDEAASRWTITTTRDDRISAKFLITAGGILHKAKLPAIEGINDFAGRAFHTARWDYGFTGGSPTEPMDHLKDKVVGIIGTGATAIQVVPQLARSAKEVYVFQRTPSPVGVRANGPIEPGWVKEQPPGWQAERMANFTECVTGGKPSVNLVGDGATRYLWDDTQQAAATPEEQAELERLDFEVMQAIRDRVDQVVDDPDTAELLKPWYGKHCKRITYHDEYLQSFNRPNVHLVDTAGQGVRQVTAAGPVVDGKEYELDLLVYASGFEVTTGLVSRLGFDPVGVGGVKLSERWHDGAHTLHGVLTNGFPNLLVCHFIQAGFGLNFTHYLQELTAHLTWIVATAEESEIASIEATVEAEDAWLAQLWEAGKGFGRYAAACTPSFHNSEGARTMAAARNVVHPGNLMRYSEHLERWRDAGSVDDLAGVTITR
ncbi:MAG TPA: NAD(P)/FAD-dependent oxidoreductase [Acidimicrobiales bacterium]|nr:NAD(P)/FAD-dependent oxidoreductase [Acidimicrobiales bacterium]